MEQRNAGDPATGDDPSLVWFPRWYQWKNWVSTFGIYRCWEKPLLLRLLSACASPSIPQNGSHGVFQHDFTVARTTRVDCYGPKMPNHNDRCWWRARGELNSTNSMPRPTRPGDGWKPFIKKKNRGPFWDGDSGVALGELQDPVDWRYLTYHMFGHLFCGDIPWTIGIFLSPLCMVGTSNVGSWWFLKIPLTRCATFLSFWRSEWMMWMVRDFVRETPPLTRLTLLNLADQPPEVAAPDSQRPSLLRDWSPSGSFWRPFSAGEIHHCWNWAEQATRAPWLWHCDCSS